MLKKGPAGLLLAAVLVLLLAGVGGVLRQGGSETSASLLGGPAAPVATPQLQVEGAAAERPFDAPLEVRAVDGQLSEVTVTDDRGTSLAGAVSYAGDRWTSTGPLKPLSRYGVEAVLLDASGEDRDAGVQVATAAPEDTSKASISPTDGRTVGVGMPVAVSFEDEPEDRAAVTAGLSVETPSAVEGAWRWVSDSEVHWRPREYWPAGTPVTVRTDLARTELGDGVYGTDRSVSFTVGSANITTVDNDAHTMTVRRDGVVVDTYPVSLGQRKYPTHGGVHIVLDKEAEKTMDSSTVGITGDEAYVTEVKWATRISNSGEFVHAAPWSVGSQGESNVSHGCVNASTSDAKAFYDMSKIGDVVEVTNADDEPLAYDAGTMDWNMTWEEWTAPQSDSDLDA